MNRGFVLIVAQKTIVLALFTVVAIKSNHSTFCVQMYIKFVNPKIYLFMINFLFFDALLIHEKLLQGFFPVSAWIIRRDYSLRQN